MKRIIALLLTAVLAAGLLCGCNLVEQLSQAKFGELSGTWTRTGADTEEQALALLENIDMYEEEIALVDMTSLQDVRIAQFNEDKTYRFAFDVEGTKQCVRAFYAGAFDALYEGRTSLNEAYSMEFDAMTRDEFNAFYTELYECSDFDAMLDQFTDIAYDYEALAEDIETGTYTIVLNNIMCTVTGETEAESLGYAIEGDQLTLNYADATHVYTKVP